MLNYCSNAHKIVFFLQGFFVEFWTCQTFQVIWTKVECRVALSSMGTERWSSTFGYNMWSNNHTSDSLDKRIEFGISVSISHWMLLFGKLRNRRFLLEIEINKDRYELMLEEILHLYFARSGEISPELFKDKGLFSWWKIYLEELLEFEPVFSDFSGHMSSKHAKEWNNSFFNFFNVIFSFRLICFVLITFNNVYQQKSLHSFSLENRGLNHDEKL